MNCRIWKKYFKNKCFMSVCHIFKSLDT